LVTVAAIGQRILDQNNWTTSEITVVEMEYIIDNAIDYINLDCGTSIADLTGSAGAKSLVGTEDENITVQILSSLLSRAFLDKGPSTNLGPMGVAQIITDPHYSLYTKLLNRSLNKLRGRYFETV
jgi:hypothetical protein